MKRLRVKKRLLFFLKSSFSFGVSALVASHSSGSAKTPERLILLSVCLSLSLSVAVMQPRAVITKKGNLVVGCKSGRMAVSYDTCSNLVAKHRVLPSIVPHVTHTDLDFSIIGVLAKYRPRPRTLRCQRWRSNSKPRSLNVN